MFRALYIVGFLVTCTLMSQASWAQDGDDSKASKPAEYQSGYNEIFDENGVMRPAYQQFEAYTQKPILSPSSHSVQELAIKNPLQDKVKVLPIPVILTDADNLRIQQGARQRLLAIVSFFEDVVMGDGAIYSQIDQTKIAQLFKDELWNIDEVRRLWKGKSKQYLSVQSGSDLARTADNQFAVYEDNLGLLGGIVDYTHIRNAFIEHNQLDPRLRDEPGFLYEGLTDFFSQADADPKRGEVVAFMSGVEKLKKLKAHEKPYEDLEWLRRANVLEAHGIEIWNPSELTDAQTEKLYSGKVKAIVNFSEPDSWSEIRKMWNDLFLERGIYFFQSPGINAISNKGFLEYVPTFIKFYLHEEPILVSPKTRILDMTSSNEIEIKPNKVYKLASGLQGKDVFISHRLSPEKLEEARFTLSQFRDMEQLTGAPLKRWIEQEYVEPSLLPGGAHSWLSYILDYRPITMYSGGTIRHMPTPWVRASSNLGDGKNNVTRGAFEVVTFTESCGKLLVK